MARRRWFEFFCCAGLIGLAVLPIVPALVAAAIMFFFNDTADPAVWGQVVDIVFGVSVLTASLISIAFFIVKRRLWIIAVTIALIAIGYLYLFPYRDLIFTIMTGH